MSEKSNSNKSEPAAVLQRPDEILKETYAKGGFGSPDRIGRVMQTIRERRPLTESEWRAWYLANVRSETELLNLAGEMFREIPRDAPVTMRQTLDFIENMIFSVSFRGYDKSNLALQFLKSVLNPPGADAVCAAPLDWREKYDIDFYAAMAGSLLGIRLRPADEDKPSREGEWAEEKRKAFSEKYGEDKAETLLYVRTPEGYAPDPRQKELWLKLRRLICINRLKKLGKLEERIPPDFDKLQDEILARKTEGQKASFPFLVEHKDATRDICWFTYGIREEGESGKKKTVCVHSVFTVDPSGAVTQHSGDAIEVPHGKQLRQAVNYGAYISRLKELYESDFTANKMNSLLWEYAAKPMYDSYLKVISFIKQKAEELPEPFSSSPIH